jgi:Membrane bound FAD containing D-sorbitol dehydrogenase
MTAIINYPDLFFQFSKLVCGDESLSPGLSKVYFDIFHTDPTLQPDLIKLLDRFSTILNTGEANPEKAISDNILMDDSLRASTLLIIKLWYLGFMKSLTTGPPDSEALKGGGYYFHHEALIWKVASAHPAGLSGGYYGYWSYKPEN